MIKKLRTDEKTDYRLIIFNADAVNDPDYYLKKSEPSMLYLPVDIWGDRRRFVSVSPC